MLRPGEARNDQEHVCTLHTHLPGHHVLRHCMACHKEDHPTPTGQSATERVRIELRRALKMAPSQVNAPARSSYGTSKANACKRHKTRCCLIRPWYVWRPAWC